MMISVCMTASAQSSTKSPYSQFGLGVLSEQSQGMSRGMNGVGIGLHQSNQINTLNPASYGSVDSLTMLFDAGITGQLTNFKEGTTRQNAKSANFEYIVASFRAWRNVGVSVGVLPYTNIGYSYNSKSTVNQEYGTLTEAYSGEGGLHEAFIGMGWHLLKPLSIGVNAGYLWGDLDKSVISANSNISTLKKSYSTEIKSYKLDAGIQWCQPLSKRDVVTLGATVGIGHKLGADAKLDIINVTNTDTTSFKAENAYEIPWSWGVGLAWQHANSLTVAADLEMKQWGKTSYPTYKDGMYLHSNDIMKDQMKVNIGAEWIPNSYDVKNYLNRVHYRIGAGLSTPYYKIKGSNGPSEFTVSAGLGLPVSRSMIQISGQWVRSAAKGFVTDNTFRINIGLTFNERWFAKWKVD